MKVALFPSCLVDQLYPEVGFAALRVLRQAGVEVSYDPALICCGQPAFNSGRVDEAGRAVKVLLQSIDDELDLVSLSGSCACMIKVFAARITEGDDRRRATQLAERTWEFSDFLVTRLDAPELSSPFEGVVAYHDSCHALRELDISEQPRRLLRRIKGVELREIDDSQRCCGFGGLFSAGYAELSAALAHDKVEAIRRTGASWVVSTDVSCLMQIEGVLKRAGHDDIRAVHLAQILDPGP